MAWLTTAAEALAVSAVLVGCRDPEILAAELSTCLRCLHVHQKVFLLFTEHKYFCCNLSSLINAYTN